MNKNYFTKQSLISAIILFCFLIMTSLFYGQNISSFNKTKASANQIKKIQKDKIDNLKKSNKDLKIGKDKNDSSVIFISGGEKTSLPFVSKVSSTLSSEDAASTFMNDYKELFSLNDASKELKVMKKKKSDNGRSFVRFQRHFNNIPVFAAESIVQLNNNEVESVISKNYANFPVSTSPAITGVEAEIYAFDHLSQNLGIDDFKSSEPALWVFDSTLLNVDFGPPHLVWRMDVKSESRLDIDYLVLVNAMNGEISLAFNQVESAKNRQVYDTSCTANLPGTLVISEGGSLVGHDADRVNAYNYAGDTYDFYKTYHNRDSINNAGMTIISTVDYDDDGGCDYPNAFWDGSQMVYGTGYASADDVVGHELTHGVTEHESYLLYFYQSGAINESFSDIWGEFVDQTNGEGNDTPSVKWLMGEDLGGAIRSMADPTIYNDPDKMSSTNWWCYHDQAVNGSGDSMWDYGGVHMNSGINNKLAYLLTDGGSFNGKTITGMGISKVAKLYYEVQTNLLVSGADYLDLYYALAQAAINLGWTGTEKTNLNNACLSVEIYSIGERCDAIDEAPVCNSGSSNTDIYFENVEGDEVTISAKWGTQATQGQNLWWLWEGYSTSGVGSFHGETWDKGANVLPDDSSMYMKTDVLLPANAYLHFKHSFQFDDNIVSGGSPYYDGAVVEYSINGGSTWFDAAPLFTENGYNGTIYSPTPSSNQPLHGRNAFVGESHGYISSRLNLSSLAGQNIRFKFKVGTSNFIEPVVWSTGWFIDDIRIYTCSAVQPTNNADFISQSIPSTMNAGQTYQISVTMQNNGTTDWVQNSSNPHKLGDPVSNTWGVQRVDLSVGETISSGQSKTFTFNITAPTQPGQYEMQWQMVQENVQWFGEKTTKVNIVIDNNAEFVSQSVPTTMIEGQTYEISVTMNNNGTSNWIQNSSNPHKLGEPVSNTWGVQRVDLSLNETILPTQSKTFTFNVIAPSQFGQYEMQWQMLQENVEWFGEKTDKLYITINEPELMINNWMLY